MRFPPIAVWESFPTFDPAHPVRSGNALIIVNVVFMVLITAAVALRLWTRLTLKRQCGYDDYAIVIALFFALSLGANSIVANTHYGWDRHVWELPFDLFQPASICAFVGKILFTLAATFTRVSLILFYYRLIHDANIAWFRWVLHLSMLWTGLVCIAFVGVSVFICSPVQSYWVFPLVPGYKCLNEGTVVLAAGIVNCVSDLEVTLLPIPLVMRLQLPLRTRLCVMILLSLGFIVTAAGTVRTYYIWKSLVDSWDETWYAYQLWISACVEIDLAVLCACAPALKPAVSRLLSHVNKSVSTIISRTSSSLNLPHKKASSNASTASAPGHRAQVYTPPHPMRRRNTPSVSLLSSGRSWNWLASQPTPASQSTVTASTVDAKMDLDASAIERTVHFNVDIEDEVRRNHDAESHELVQTKDPAAVEVVEEVDERDWPGDSPGDSPV